jgi:hypothetical protein
MLSPGGSAERTRGLDLGADDVLSLPFDSHELLSRVRSQLRDKSFADGFRERLRIAEENRNATQQVVTAVNEERRTLRVGGLTAIAVLVVAALVFFLLYRRNQQQTTRVYAAITRLQTGMLTEQRLMESSRRGLEASDHDPSLASDSQKAQLQKERGPAVADCSQQDENTPALQNQLTAVETRLQKLERGARWRRRSSNPMSRASALSIVALPSRAHHQLRLHYAEMTSNGAPD